jgi:chromosome segregation ATPase
MTYKNFLSKIPMLVFAFAITTFAFHASAEYYKPGTNPNATTSPKTLRGEIKDKRQEVRAEVEQKKGEIKTNLEQEREKIKSERIQFVNKQVGNLVEQMTKRFNAAVERLTKIADRIDSRIAKIKATGKDTSGAEASVADARAKINQAKTDIAKIPDLVNEGIATTTPKERFSGLRTLADTIRKELEGAQSSLTKALKTLRGLSPEHNATTTPPTASSTSN